jgi:biopolymer transport protein ExbD
MAAPGGSSGKRRRGTDQGEPIDLDMTPMMNMLIILISFLVTMVVFTQLAVIKFDLPSADAGAGPGGTPADTAMGKDADLTLVVSESGFQIIGEGRKLDPVPKGAGGYDFQGLAGSLRKLREDFPVARSMVMLIDSSVIYQDIVSAMDVCREHSFPDILLSGGVYQ